LLHADHVYAFNYTEMLEQHRRTGADATIGVQRIERRFVRLFGMVDVGADHQVRKLVEKPQDPTSDLIFTAFCLFRLDALRAVLDRLTAQPEPAWQHDVSRDVLPHMIAHGYRVGAYPVRPYWADIGTVERYHAGAPARRAAANAATRRRGLPRRRTGDRRGIRPGDEGT
jgi:glucose-1-phosphate adenylyltransferase